MQSYSVIRATEPSTFLWYCKYKVQGGSMVKKVFQVTHFSLRLVKLIGSLHDLLLYYAMQ